MRLVIICLIIAGCQVSPEDDRHDHPILSDDQASYFHIKAKILTDVRIWRELHLHLERGRKQPGNPGSAGFRLQEFEAFVLRDDPKEQRDAVTEIAFYSPSTGAYFYHYLGGPKSLDVWMGPFSLTPSKCQRSSENPPFMVESKPASLPLQMRFQPSH